MCSEYVPLYIEWIEFSFKNGVSVSSLTVSDSRITEHSHQIENLIVTSTETLIVMLSLPVFPVVQTLDYLKIVPGSDVRDIQKYVIKFQI
jgi:hypothetical protein